MTGAAGLAALTQAAGALYGRFIGLQQTGLALAIAAGPFAAGAHRDAPDSYLTPRIGAVVLFAAAVPAILAVRDARPPA